MIEPDELGYMGKFLHISESDPHTNLHSIINDIFTRPVSFHPEIGAVITKEVQFPDVSFYQGDIDYNIMKQHTKAVIIRVGQGRWVDTKFERNYAEAKKAGLKIGFYWFDDDRVSPEEQAKLLLSLLKGKTWDMEVFIDWENTYGGPYKGLKYVVKLMQLVEAGIPGVEVGLYSGYYFIRSNSDAVTNAQQYAYLKNKRLWLAWYTHDFGIILIPLPWFRLHDLQWGTPVVEWGQDTSELDMNFFNGTVQEFHQLYGGEGDTMLVIIGSVLQSVKIRTSPAGEELVPPRYLIAGNMIEADRNEAQWLHLTKINGVNVTGEQWASAGLLEQYISWEWINQDPAPVPPVRVKVHQIDTFSDGKISVDNGPVI